MNPNENYGLQEIMRCKGIFISCNKCTTVVQDVDSWGGCACVGTEVYGNPLYVLFNFAVNLKLLFESLLLFLKPTQ